MGTTLVTGLGLVGTSYAQNALKRGESIVFYDMAPRKDFLANKLGSANVTVVQRDIRDLPSLIETIQKHKCDTVLHTAGLIGGKVGNPIAVGIALENRNPERAVIGIIERSGGAIESCCA